MATVTIDVMLKVTVHRHRWMLAFAEEPRGDVPGYVLNHVQQAADRLVELGARVYAGGTRVVYPDVEWPAVMVDIVVEVDEVAWRKNYGTTPAVAVPHYVAAVAWQANGVLHETCGTVELVTT